MAYLALVIMAISGCGEKTPDAGRHIGNPHGQPKEGTIFIEDISVSSPFSEDISVGGPFRKITLREKRPFSNYHYDIEFRDRADKVVQTLSIRNGVPIEEKDVHLVDLNADGFKDIIVLGGTDRSGENWYKTWLWNTEQRKYVWITERQKKK